MKAERKESNLLRLKSKEIMKKRTNSFKLNTAGIEVTLLQNIILIDPEEKKYLSYDPPDSQFKKTEHQISEFNLRFILGLFSELVYYFFIF